MGNDAAYGDSEEILSRLSLMESLIEQGRECTRRWGEFGVLWGLGSLIAYVWNYRTGNWHSWLWLDVVAYPLTVLLLLRRWRRHRASTLVMRFVNALWFITGLSTSVVGFLGGMGSDMSYRAIGETVFLSLGTANLVSGWAFRWPLQFSVGLLFWLGAAVLIFTTGSTYFWVYTSVQFFGEFCFGVYLMMTEQRNQYV